MRFGPALLQQVVVPEDAKPGDVVKFEGSNGEQLEVRVPEGKVPGDMLEVTPPAMMVQVPEGALPGDELHFTSPNGEPRMVILPKGLQGGQYIPAAI